MNKNYSAKKEALFCAPSQTHPLFFTCVLVVWGNYTQLFLEMALPTQLASDNLPCLNKQTTIYQIYTTKEDESVICQHPAFEQLASLCSIRFYTIEIEENKYQLMSKCHKKAIDTANVNGSALIFLTPDSILSNGSLQTVKKLAHSGKRVVSTVGLRLKKERVMKLLENYRNPNEFSINISSTDLMKIALNNLHPITLKHIWGGDTEMIPNNLFWLIPNEGLVGRCFHLHPLMVNPLQRTRKFLSTIDYDYPMSACPNLDDHYVITNSDEVCICELTTEKREMMGPPNSSMKALVLFTERHANPNHLHNVKQIIQMHTGTQTFGKWQKAIADSNAVLKRLHDALNKNLLTLFFSNRKQFLFRILRQEEELFISTKIGYVKKLQIYTFATIIKLCYNRLSIYIKNCIVFRIRCIYQMYKQAIRNEP